MNENFIIEPNAKVTFIDQTNGKRWNKWKLYSECNEREKQEVNLASYPQNSILFDRDLPDYSLEQREEDYKGFKEMMIKRGILYFYSYPSPHGYHIIAPFEDLDKLDNELKNEIKKYYVTLFMSDPAKISGRGVVSLPGRPHFKNGVVYNIDTISPGLNKINPFVLEECKRKVEEQSKLLSQINTESDFKDYFEKDPFFDYIKNNTIPENTNRDMNIFSNLAVASVKSGKTKEEIDNLLKPIIQKNFPGKSYQEFEGWYKKALKGEMTDYNPIQLNTWLKTYTNLKEGLYDLKPIIMKPQEKNIWKYNFLMDKDLSTLKNSKIEWVVDTWLPRGDICFLAGRAASFKTTIVLHMAYAISQGKLVFNKYPTIPTKVLYLNEENSIPIFLNIIDRVKKGLEINDLSDNIWFSMLEGIRLDSTNDLQGLTNFINKNEIGILICDSFRRFVVFDENNATEMNKLFENLKLIRKLCPNISIIILHHLKKENSQFKSDMRDMLRGSSDIVNAADSVIGISRKAGSSSFKISHIKSRSRMEAEEKLIMIDEGDNKDESYFYESDKELKKEDSESKPEKDAWRIMNYLKERKIKEFKRQDLQTIFPDIPYNGLTKTLNILVDEQSLIRTQIGKYGKYIVVDEESNDKTDTQEKLISD